MKAIDMKEIYRKYKGKWVALKGPNSNKVISFGKNLKRVVEAAQKRGISMPVVAQIPKKVLPIVGPFSFK